MNAWIRRRPNPASRIRLFCFPHAGGGASLFARWPRLAESNLEICAFQHPGHEDRIKEAAITELPALLDGVIGAMRDLLDKPYALFGHSFGAHLAFHVTNVLRTRLMPGPAHVFVSGSSPPGARLAPLLTELSDRDFIAHIVQWYGGISPLVLAAPELLQAVLPGMRADFRLFDQMADAPAPPLDVPISAFGGLTDQAVSQPDLERWAPYTRHRFRLQMFEGDHFYLRIAEPALLQSISHDLQPVAAGGINR